MSAEDTREALVVLRSLIQEVWTAHRDKDHNDYNECEVAECAWCQETRENLTKLEAASRLAAPVGEKETARTAKAQAGGHPR